MKRVLCGMVLVVGVFAVIGPQTAKAELATLASSSFTHRYEMVVDPTTENLDGVSGNDFSCYPASGTGTVADGILTLPATAGKYYVSGPAAGESWNNLSYAAGWTLEVSMKSAQVTGGWNGSVGLWGSTDSGTGHPSAVLTVGDSFMKWDFAAMTTIDTSVNNDTFHTFRIAQLPGEASFSVWRDGRLVQSGLGSGFNDSVSEFNLGSITQTVHGPAQIDYVRFTSGAYAPVPTPEPSTIALLSAGMLSLLVHAWKKRK